MKNLQNKIQKYLNKLISEEIIARDQYLGSIYSSLKSESQQYSKIFNDIAVDEYDDHFKKLSKYAIENDYKVPFKYKDFEKYTDPKVLKVFNAIKHNQKAEYYIEQAVKAEKLAVDSYSTILKDQDLPYDFSSILWQIYYDEVEHLEKFSILNDALKAGAELLGF